MTNQVQLTVLLPVFNTREDWLRKAIESILNQTYRDFSLFILDDGSVIETKKIIEEYRQSDDRIKVIENEKNMGLIWTLNNGLKQVSTEYFARMDADDFSYPDRFEKQISYLYAHPEVNVLGSNAYVMGTQRLLHKDKYFPKTNEDIRAGLWKTCYLVHPSLIVKTELIKNAGGYPQKKNSEDYALWLELTKSNEAVFANIAEPLIEYRDDRSRLKYKEKQKDNAVSVRRDYLIYLGLDANEVDACIDNLFRSIKVDYSDFKACASLLDKMKALLISKIPHVSKSRADYEVMLVKRKKMKVMKNPILGFSLRLLNKFSL